MIPKSGDRFSEQIMLRQEGEHDPEPKDRVSEKWRPVFGKGHAQARN